VSKKTIYKGVIIVVAFASFLAWFLDSYTKYWWVVFVFIGTAIASGLVAYKFRVKKGKNGK
jgi:phosphatidylserine synthase